MSYSCSDEEIIIKDVDIYPSYNVYQNARMGYLIQRTKYGLTVNFDYPNYSNRSIWRQMLYSNSLNDVAFSALEVPLTNEERERYPDLMAIPTMLG